MSSRLSVGGDQDENDDHHYADAQLVDSHRKDGGLDAASSKPGKKETARRLRDRTRGAPEKRFGWLSLPGNYIPIQSPKQAIESAYQDLHRAGSARHLTHPFCAIPFWPSTATCWECACRLQRVRPSTALRARVISASSTKIKNAAAVRTIVAAEEISK